MLEADNLKERLAETSEHLNPKFNVLFDEMLEGPRRPPGPRARGPRDAGRGDHALPHDHRGDARPHRPALHHRVQRGRRARCPASSRASTRSRATSTGTWPSARASCATWPRRTSATARRSSARWSRSARPPTACSRRPWYEEGETSCSAAHARRDARVRDEGARAPAEGDRPRPAVA